KKVIIDIIKKLKWGILGMTLLLVFNSYLLICPPKIIGKIIDLLYNIEGNKQLIINYTYYLLGVCIVYLVNRIIWKRLEIYVARDFERQLKIVVFKRFLKLKLKDIQNIKNGEIMSYFVKDINEVRAGFYRLVSQGTRTIFLSLIAIFQMINEVDIYLTAVILIPLLIGLYTVIKIKKYIETSFKKSQEMFTDMSEYIQESTDSIRTTKAYSCEGKQLKDFIRKNTKVRSSNNVVDVYSNLLKMSLNICFGLCYRNCFNIWLKVSNRPEKLQ
ncbi:MAG: hypothetical protein K2H53_04830, partial [Clostridia bacterium]|nr:hypothetical protein [Clostridia bacterium]